MLSTRYRAIPAIVVILMSECNCTFRNEWDAGWEDDACRAESVNGKLCSKPEGHDGPHAACALGEHPVEVFEDA